MTEPLPLPKFKVGEFVGIDDTPEAFEFFFELVVGKQLPPHARRWIKAIYEAKEQKRGVIIESFRGSAKSTIMTVFMAWRMGHNPMASNIIIRSSMNSANDAGARVAKIISHNSAWKLFFPHVVPLPGDKRFAGGGGSWSAGSGYEIYDNRMSVEEWAQRNAKRTSPSLTSFAYSSKSIIGNRATGVLLIDDIHDEDNTTSELELQRTIRSWTDTISRTRTPECWTIFIGTPWLTNDLLAQLKETGEYVSLKTRVMGPDGEPTWPQMFDKEGIEKLKREDLTGGPGFARMYMCDPSQMENRIFTYHNFPEDAIEETWLMRGGVDYASIEGGGNMRYRSHFALAYVGQNPIDGKWVVVDGVLAQMSQGQAEQAVVAAQQLFPNWDYATVEADGKGAEFIAVLARHPDLKIVPEKTHGVKKRDRITKGLEPILRNGTLRISTASTPFLDRVRMFLNLYPNVSRNDPGWDALDAIYWAVYHELVGLTPDVRNKRPWERTGLREVSHDVNPILVGLTRL